MTSLESNTNSMVSNQASENTDNVLTHNQHTLRECVEIAMVNYFKQIDGQKVTDLYELVINEVEAPLLESVLAYTGGNQTKASVVMGLNRGTLRKKLKKYNML